MTTKEKILELLKQGKYAAQIAKELKVSEAYISKVIKKAQESGEVKPLNQTSVKLYTIEPTVARIGSTSQVKPSLRLHRLIVSYPLAEHADSLKEAKLVRLRNNSQQILQKYGIELRVTTKHLVLTGPQLIGPLEQEASILLQEARKMSMAIAMQAEQEYRLKLQRGANSEVLADFRLVEIEIQRHDLARKVEERGIVPLYWDADTKKVLVWTDKSGGLDNLESNKVDYLEKLRKFTQGLVEAKWSIQEQLALNQKVVENQSYQLRFFRSHNKLMDEIRRDLKHRRLQHKKENREETDARQRKLNL